MTEKLTPEAAAAIVAVITGGAEKPAFATTLPADGDVALIVRASGGIEMLSTIPDNPGKDSLASLGVRGFFLLALYRLAQNPDLMADALVAVAADIDANPVAKLDS